MPTRSSTAQPLSRVSSWDTLYDTPSNWALVSYEDLQELPSGSEADLAKLESHFIQKL